LNAALSRRRDSRNGNCCGLHKTCIPADAKPHSSMPSALVSNRQAAAFRTRTAADHIAVSRGLRCPTVSVLFAAASCGLRPVHPERAASLAIIAGPCHTSGNRPSPSKSYWPIVPIERRDGRLFGVFENRISKGPSTRRSRLAHSAHVRPYDFDRYSTSLSTTFNVALSGPKKVSSPTVI